MADNKQNTDNIPEVNAEGSEQSETLAGKSKQRSQKHKHKVGFYYSFLTLVLLFCLIQIGFGVILNISKTISYRAKISTMEKIRNSAENNNHQLKQEIKLFSSMSSLEGIARNNLKMAGEDEVLILINNNPPENAVVKKNKKKHKNK